ncbi:hypothetical protein UFOVP28_85 [uncultured Caudovirales phage]|uniref:Uncharacterized protein n=1 Tax=uncultured Caudovirales phage TaxID=2100421 RepID=A0A6J5KPV8_9CAUD|nr:hypothetical protein UFOVP28_85 [uncultured Caudovirales phage]
MTQTQTQTQDLDALIEETHRECTELGGVINHTTMFSLFDALTALRQENERLKAFADEMQAFAAEMEKHPQTFRANQTVAYSIRLALKRHTPNPTGDK